MPDLLLSSVSCFKFEQYIDRVSSHCHALLFSLMNLDYVQKHMKKKKTKKTQKHRNTDMNLLDESFVYIFFLYRSLL